ncbi:MAG TPA: cache domain-containing protein [Candidatus Hydrogenedens sp.]|nr:cache domain-containing protein [Candidatus Hydrogenedens sp.]HOL20857.1 cache domain-containing protein [Candidatus Hydrogenedens sp.]HPP59503.1 cache domain-containing protein [Candidatus Hydrogenedens sp.]
MKINQNSIKFRFIGNLIIVFILLTVIISILQIILINNLVIKASNERIKLNMKSGWYYFQEKQRKLEIILNFLQHQLYLSQGNPETILTEVQNLLSQYAESYDIDYLWIIPTNTYITNKFILDEIKSFFEKENSDTTSGYIKKNFKKITEILPFNFQSKREIPDDEPISMYVCRKMIYENTNKEHNEIILIAGNWLDGANHFVDQIQNIVFEDRFYKGRRVGTVTIFNGSRRVATTVLLPNGQRAVGTQVSESVKQQTLIKGIPWTGRAKVLNDWYLTSYEPIRDVHGNIIGMFYMGELEAVTKDTRTLVVFITIIIILLIMSIALAVRLKQTTRLLKRIYKLRNSAHEFANGNYTIRVENDHIGDEISELVSVFNSMLETIEKDREQLIKQQELIEEANANYLDMLGFVTHELRNSLGSALFNIASLKEGAFGEVSTDAKEGLNIVEDSLKYLKEITNNYLQLSRLEQGDLYFEKREVNLLNEVIKPVLNELLKMIEIKKLNLKNEVPEEFTLPADVNLMRVVYENLLGNAIKYVQEEGNIKISATRDEDGKIKLVVWNDGPPIEPQLLTSLFHRFRRYDTKTPEGKKGAGLGLFIVRRIIELHGGQITLQSTPENGTSFIITLP